MQAAPPKTRALAMAASVDYTDGLLATLASVLAFSGTRSFDIYLAHAADESVDDLRGRLNGLCGRFGYPESRLHLGYSVVVPDRKPIG